jgi:catechol 2,3-dioxygenase-like lactoylglutathione lyase family enzyme
MKIRQLDHLVLTVDDLDRTIQFYTTVLGMELVTFENRRKALRFGTQKINLHKAGQEVSPNARHPLPGSLDLCFISDTSMEQIIEHLNSCEIPILEGPVKRTGATGPLLSIYIQDPDGNLIEISIHLTE